MVGMLATKAESRPPPAIGVSTWAGNAPCTEKTWHVCTGQLGTVVRTLRTASGAMFNNIMLACDLPLCNMQCGPWNAAICHWKGEVPMYFQSNTGRLNDNLLVIQMVLPFVNSCHLAPSSPPFEAEVALQMVLMPSMRSRPRCRTGPKLFIFGALKGSGLDLETNSSSLLVNLSKCFRALEITF